MKMHLDWLHNPKWHTITDRVLQILVQSCSFYKINEILRKKGIFILLAWIKALGQL